MGGLGRHRLRGALHCRGSLAFGSHPSGSGADPATVQGYFADSGHRDRVSSGWILIVLGVVFFPWFLSSLRQRLGHFDGGGFLTTLAAIGGIVHATLALVSISINAAIKTMSAIHSATPSPPSSSTRRTMSAT